MGINLFKLSTIDDFKSLMGNETLLVIWNDEAEIWDKEMQGMKVYDIKIIQKGNAKSEYPEEILLKHKGNIFFNFRMFVESLSLNDSHHVVKEAYMLQEDSA